MGFASDQSRDCPLGYGETPKAYLRYLFARSYESRTGAGKGQDYLAWQEFDDRTLGFVICDGVGSSFCGNIAAEYLAGRLLNTFLNPRLGPPLDLQQESGIQEQISFYLRDWQREGQAIVDREPIPAELPQLIQDALAQQKQEHGSETLFVCGRISLTPQENRQLILIWMGDSEVRLYNANGARHEIGGTWTSSDRWSTKRGKRNDVHIRVIDLDEHRIERIIVFSDGLAKIGDRVHQLDDHQLRSEVMQLFLSPTSDDISFLDIRLKPVPGDTGLPAPQQLRSDADHVYWSAVDGADTYEAEIAANALFYDPERRSHISATQLALPEKAPTSYHYIRVRAHSEQGPGVWSNAHPIEPSFNLPAPDPIVIQSTERGPQPYTISWQGVTPTQTYILIETLAVSDNPYRREIPIRGASQYQVSNQQPGIYCYQVEALGTYGESSKSKVSEPYEVPPILHPIELNQAGDVSLSWQTGHAEPALYEIQKASDEQFSEPEMQEEVSEAFYCDPRPARPGSYYYRVRVAGQQTWSQPESIDIPKPRAKRSSEEKRKKDSKGGNAASSSNTRSEGNSSERHETAGTVEPPTEPKEESQSEASPTNDKTPAIPLAAPEIEPLSSVPVGQTYHIRWSSVDGASWYELQEAQSSILAQAGQFQTLCEIEQTSFPRFHSDPGEKLYRVRALDADFEGGEWSEVCGMNIEKPLEPRTPYMASPSDVDEYGTFTIRWQAVPGATRYELEEKKGGSFIPPALPQTNLDSTHETSFVYRHKEPGTYEYRVRSVIHDKVSEFSEPVEVIVPKPQIKVSVQTKEMEAPSPPSAHVPVQEQDMKLPAPSPPEFLAQQNMIRIQVDQIYRLEWKPVLDVNRYEIQQARSSREYPKENEYDFTKDLSTNSVNLRPEEPGRYFFRVRSIDSRGQESQWSRILRIDVVDQQIQQDITIQVNTVINTWWLPRYFDWYRSNFKNAIIVKLVWQSDSPIKSYLIKWKRVDISDIPRDVYLETNEKVFELRPGRHELRVCVLDPDGNPNGQWSNTLRVDVYHSRNRLQFKDSFIT